MSRKLIIDGNAVYELDENCMLKKRIDTEERQEIVRKRDGKESEREAGKRTEKIAPSLFV